MRPRIDSERTLFAPPATIENWEHLRQVTSSRSQVTAAFKALAKRSEWQGDPRLTDTDAEAVEEVLQLYSKVLDEGHVVDFVRDPARVIRKLDLHASKRACDLIDAPGGSSLEDHALLVARPHIVLIAVGVAVTVVAVVVASASFRSLVIDESDRIKLGDQRVKSKKKKKKARKR
jgi:hypothetical protein